MRKLIKQILGRVRRNSSCPAVSVEHGTAATREDIRRKQLGRLGEDAAEEALLRNGYRILDRNYSCRSGEIDIIAEHDGHIAFVEVKTRSPRSWNTPESAVTTEKQARIIRAAAYYLGAFRDPSPTRYDIVSVFTDDEGAVTKVEVKAGAFNASKG